MRRRLSPEERREELLAFGQGFFAEHPADAFTMDQIAARAGVSKGLLYNYFGGRRGFYVATVEAIAQQVSILTEPEGDMAFVDALQRALARYLGWVEDHGDVYRVLVQGGLGVDPEVAAIVERLRRTTVERVTSRMRVTASPALRLAIYGWVCFAEHACLEWLSQPEVDADAMLALLTGALAGAISGAGLSWDEVMHA
ncbi:MAG: TetR/AcrR family transcriptional regulator [Myxococcota bacterium]|nr:TetR/AcrR family transcriptional regulator [Myxococcota bacterium]